MKTLITLFATLIAFTLPAIAGGDWLTEIEAGVKQAKKENKSVLVEFTGSDWCPPCIMMDKKVFSKKEFLKQAKEGYVLVKIDIPKSDKELSDKNKQVMAKWGVSGVPTVLLLDAEGKEFHRFSASKYSTVEKFIAHLARAKELKGML